MRLFRLVYFILFTLVQITYVIPARSDNCPCERNPCESPSTLSNLICYMYRKANGLNYAMVGFGNGISALCRINFKCAPGKESCLEVLQVDGFIFELCYSNETRQTCALWYVDVTRGESCPRVFPVRNAQYSEDGTSFDSALYPTPVPADLADLMYMQMKLPYPGQCSIFQADKNCGCDYCCRGSECDCPVASISLKQLKSALFVSPALDNDTVVQRYLNNYGVCGVNCAVSSTPEPGSNPPLLTESCALTGYNDTALYCKDYRNTPQLCQILKSYGYNQNRKKLNSQDVCNIATLWAQGLNDKNSAKPCSYNCGYTTSFCTIAILPQLENIIYDPSSPEVKVAIVYILVEGYIESYIKETILKYFLNAC